MKRYLSNEYHLNFSENNGIIIYESIMNRRQMYLYNHRSYLDDTVFFTMEHLLINRLPKSYWEDKMK